MVQNHEGLQSDLRVLVEENGKALWDGVSPIDVWEATAAQNAEWEQSRDQAIRDGEIDLDAGDNPDEWNVQNFPDIASFSLQSPAASSPTDMSREEQIAAEVKPRLDAEEQQRQLALQVASMPVPSGPPRTRTAATIGT
jgi:hypothetical protein